MKFNCDAKELMDAIESTTLKGKYKYGDGLKSKSIGDYCYMKTTGNELTLQNSDNTTAVRVKLEKNRSYNLLIKKFLTFVY